MNVFLHGFLGCEEDWDGVTGDAPALALEIPGHGVAVGLPEEAYTFSGARELLAGQMRVSGPGLLCGYSLGGRLALAIALEYPELVLGLVLESASPGLREGHASRVVSDDAWARRFESEPMADVLRDWYAQHVFDSLQEKPALVSRLVERRCRNDGAEIARSLRGMSVARQESLWERLGELTCPVLLIAGADDPKYCAIAEEMAGLCPAAEIRTVPGAGHIVHLEQPAVFAAQVKQFLETL